MCQSNVSVFFLKSLKPRNLFSRIYIYKMTDNKNDETNILNFSKKVGCLEMTENIERDKLKELLKHPELNEEHRKRGKVLYDILNRKNTDYVKVKYSRPKHNGRYFGRAQAYIEDVEIDKKHKYRYKPLTCCNMWSPLRSSLFGNKEYDVDIVNCHYTLLYQLLKKYYPDVKYKNLRRYVKRREDIISEFNIDETIIERYNNKNKCRVSKKDIVKDLFTRILYNGGSKNWCDEYELPYEYGVLNNVVEMENELKQARKDLLNVNECKKYVEELKPLLESKDKEIHDGTLVSWILQETEFTLINECMKLMNETQRLKVMSYIYDGFQICYRKGKKSDKVKSSIDNKLRECEEYIKTNFGIKIKLITKEFKTPLEINEKDELNDDEYSIIEEIQQETEETEEIDVFGRKFSKKWLFNYVSSDLEAGKKVLEIYPHWKNCNGNIYLFDPKTGMWICDENLQIGFISKLTDYLHCMKRTKEGVERDEFNSYGNNDRKLRACYNCILRNDSIVENGWEKRVSNSSLGKIPFTNGWLEFDRSDEKLYFHDEFEPEVAFFDKLPFDFKYGCDLKIQKEIEEKFYSRFVGEEVSDIFMSYLGAGLLGDVSIKKFIFCVGHGDNGKSTLISVLNNLLNGFAGSFNLEHLACKNRNGDETREMAFAHQNRYSRLLMSSEGGVGSINGEKLKMLSSGGYDPIQARTLFKDKIQSFIPHFLPIVFSNDMPKLKYLDGDAGYSRIRIFDFKNTFVKQGTNKKEGEFEKDPEFINLMNTEEYKKNHINLLIKKYIHYVKGKITEPECIMMNEQNEWFEPEDDTVIKFEDEFEITRNENDYVESSVISDWLKIEKIGFTNKKLVGLLKRKHGKTISSGRKSIGGRVKRVIYGIKQISF